MRRAFVVGAMFVVTVGLPLRADADEVFVPAPQQPQQDETPATTQPLRKPMALRLDGGYATRRLFSLSVTGTDLGLAIGAQTSHHMAWWGTTRLSIGDTNNGLGVWSSRWGAEMEVVIDPVRFGIGLSLLAMGVNRASRHETLDAFGAEGRTFVRVDALRNDTLALFLRAGIDAGLEASSGSLFWGPAIGAGIELGLSGKKPASWSSASQ